MAHAHTAEALESRHRLAVVLAITIGFTVIEGVGAWLTDSLVLLADAGHMLSDVAGVALALGAVSLARRRPSARKTYGYHRAEVLATLANALIVFAVSAYIIFGAYGRFTEPPELSGPGITALAALGLAANLACARILWPHSAGMATKGALLEVQKDALGSAAAVIAGVVIITTGWRYADPILALGIGLLILPQAWRLFRSALDVLFEGAPPGTPPSEVADEILTVPGVTALHDLHVWSLTSGFVALSGHVHVTDETSSRETLSTIRKKLAERFGLTHVTIQIELGDEQDDAECAPDCYEPAPNVNAAARHR